MADYIMEYDAADPVSIEQYAGRLVGMSFSDVCQIDDITKTNVARKVKDYEAAHENKRRKGGLGELMKSLIPQLCWGE